MQQVSQGAPSFCVSMRIIICISIYVCVCMYIFVDSCRTSNKNLSCVFLLKRMGKHQTNRTEWLLNQTGLNGATNNTPVPPRLSSPRQSLSMHTDPGLLSPQHRLLHSMRRTVFCHVASNQYVRKITFSDSSEPASSLRRTELLPATQSQRKACLHVIGHASKGIHF